MYAVPAQRWAVGVTVCAFYRIVNVTLCTQSKSISISPRFKASKSGFKTVAGAGKIAYAPRKRGMGAFMVDLGASHTEVCSWLTVKGDRIKSAMGFRLTVVLSITLATIQLKSKTIATNIVSLKM